MDRPSPGLVAPDCELSERRARSPERLPWPAAAVLILLLSLGLWVVLGWALYALL